MIFANDMRLTQRKVFRPISILFLSILFISLAGCAVQNLQKEPFHEQPIVEILPQKEKTCRFSSLEQALTHHQAIADEGGWPQVPDGTTMRQGEHNSRVFFLSLRLAASCDLDELATRPDVFDETLLKAVQRFQARHGLTADGAVGKATLRELNISVKERIRQITANIECCKSVKTTQESRRIVVNIADFSLTLFENNEPLLTMPVIVGKKERQTPVCKGKISSVVINPKWNVPHIIATEDILPKIKKDPEYLGKSNIRVLRGWQSDEDIDPATIDWNSLSVENFPYRLSQTSGPDNSLGRLKFLFFNPYDIYLHDTPSKYLFHKDSRAFSSGCIRLAKPKELALYLLKGTSIDSLDALNAAIANGKTKQIPIPSPIPIHIVYITSWIDNGGNIQFRPNIYNRDPALSYISKD
jgi:murein L,D-transpeptidase YcbB/YkuD